MPDMSLHWKMGRETLAHIPQAMDEQAFWWGLWGPDLWSTYRFWLPCAGQNIRKRGALMHRKQVRVFLSALAEESRTEPMMRAYAAGYICHWRLDAAAHPYINRRAEEKPCGHVLLERELDRQMGVLEHTEIRRRAGRMPERMRKPLDRAFAVYGWRGASHELDRAMADAALFQRLTEDRHGLLVRLLSRWPKGRSYLYSWQEPWDDPMNRSHRYGLESVEEIVDRAAGEAAQWIEALCRYCDGNGPKPSFTEQSLATGAIDD